MLAERVAQVKHAFEEEPEERRVGQGWGGVGTCVSFTCACSAGGQGENDASVPRTKGARTPELVLAGARLGTLALVTREARQLDEALVKDEDGKDVGHVLVLCVVRCMEQGIVVHAVQRKQRERERARPNNRERERGRGSVKGGRCRSTDQRTRLLRQRGQCAP